MTLADESLKEPCGFSAPADEEYAEESPLALLDLIEEHGAAGRLHSSEVYEIYRRADGLLRETQDAETLARLRACARVVMRMLAGPEVVREGLNMYEAVHDFEARLIEQALEEARGSVTKAARLLGLTHQTLGTILNTRHKSLADKRTPVRRRLRSLFRKPAAKGQH
jgi:DNA-binding protein Fis